VLYYHWVGGGIGALEDAAAVFAQKACPLVHGRNPHKLWVNHRQISRIWRTRKAFAAAPNKTPRRKRLLPGWKAQSVEQTTTIDGTTVPLTPRDEVGSEEGTPSVVRGIQRKQRP
jgi:hypothetical protein